MRSDGQRSGARRPPRLVVLGALGAGVLAFGLVVGCRQGNLPSAPDGLLLTQIPVGLVTPTAAGDLLDRRYPAGSRIVRVNPSEARDSIRYVVLSAGLLAAGSPALGPDGREILFTGKASRSDVWQIYRVSVNGGPPKALTSLPGGAMEPAWLPGGRFVFSAPVPRGGAVSGEKAPPTVPALFTLSVTGGPPMRLTFGLLGATDPTVLADGRILYVSGVPGDEPNANAATSLFTINNDGTEITAFAGQHDRPAVLRRPRESGDGRIIFLSTDLTTPEASGRIEQVLLARPYRSRAVTFPELGTSCRSVEALGDGTMLAALSGPASGRRSSAIAVYRLPAGVGALGEPMFHDDGWSVVEAVSATRLPRLVGRLSNVDSTRRDAVLLCLDARFTDRPKHESAMPPGGRVRLFQQPAIGPATRLGETPLEADGSFMVNVPADVPLGVEWIDDRGRVARRCPPTFWLRPGENRSCVGCHEPHNRAPENTRPLAVLKAPVPMLPPDHDFTQAPAEPK